jgi:uncharacterized protein
MIEASHPGPVAESERIHALDVLRGLAVLGILVTNIQHFAMFAGTARDPTLYGDLHGANFWVYALTFVLAFQKFLPIFAMLFGAGIVLAAERREASGLSAATLHYRRMAVLLLIGIVHAYLIWYGDILFAYAVCGMAVFALRRLSPGPLIALGILLLAISPLIEIVFFVVPALLGAGGAHAGPSVQEVLANDLAAFRGPWIEQLRMRAHYAFEVQTAGLAIVYFWRASGIMLVGMALLKLGVLTGTRSRRLYGGLVSIALLVGLPITAAGLWVNALTNWENGWLRQLGLQIIYWFGIVMSLGWIGAVMLVCRGGRRTPLTRPLAAVGRMALTNYLLESVLCTLVFYGHGLGLYGSVERTGQIAVVIGVWVLLLVCSPIWLRFFRYGPAEWLWRSLAYGRVQPFRRGVESRLAPFRPLSAAPTADSRPKSPIKD